MVTKVRNAMDSVLPDIILYRLERNYIVKKIGYLRNSPNWFRRFQKAVLSGYTRETVSPKLFQTSDKF